jgi:hypothetical protein
MPRKPRKPASKPKKSWSNPVIKKLPCVEVVVGASLEISSETTGQAVASTENEIAVTMTDAAVPVEATAGVTTEAGAPAEGWIRRHFRYADDAEAAMIGWVEIFCHEHGRPPKQSEVLLEWARRFGTNESDPGFRGKAAFERFWSYLEPVLKLGHGRGGTLKNP